jgi:hypothetical protein
MRYPPEILSGEGFPTVGVVFAYEPQLLQQLLIVFFSGLCLEQPPPNVDQLVLGLLEAMGRACSEHMCRGEVLVGSFVVSSLLEKRGITGAAVVPKGPLVQRCQLQCGTGSGGNVLDALSLWGTAF